MAATPKPFFKAASHKSSYKHNGHFCASLALLPPCYWSNTIIGGEQFITSDKPGQKELNSAHQCEAGASSVQAKRIYIQEQPEPQTVTHCPTSIYYPSHLGCREECENYTSVNSPRDWSAQCTPTGVLLELVLHELKLLTIQVKKDWTWASNDGSAVYNKKNAARCF